MNELLNKLDNNQIFDEPEKNQAVAKELRNMLVCNLPVVHLDTRFSIIHAIQEASRNNPGNFTKELISKINQENPVIANFIVEHSGMALVYRFLQVQTEVNQLNTQS